jgi:acyl-CoA thioesterase-1
MNPLLSSVRFHTKRWFFILGMTSLFYTTFAAPDQPEASAPESGKKYSSPSLVPITDVPGLPRVLLIGDSISMGYTLPTRAALAGKANVHRPPTNCGSTISGLKNLDAWVGTNHWDVIHFNWGMHDLKYLQNGKQNVPVDQYEENLRILVTRLQKTGATLVFATTTPIPKETRGIFMRHQEDVEKYNEIAKKVMRGNGVMIDDLYSYALPKMSEIQNPNDVHQTKQGSIVISQKVAASILEALETGSTPKNTNHAERSSAASKDER